MNESAAKFQKYYTVLLPLVKENTLLGLGNSGP